MILRNEILSHLWNIRLNVTDGGKAMQEFNPEFSKAFDLILT